MSKTAITFLACVTMTTALEAQNFKYSPKNLQSAEGDRYCYQPFRLSAARYQFVDGDLRKQVMSIKEIAFRRDARTYSAIWGAGRSWSSVTIKMADGDHGTFGTSFAANTKSTATTVFQGSVTLPDFVGNPITKPALWGGVKGTLRFPFTRQWLYLGQKDILQDWTFSGGKLKNNGAWPNNRFYNYMIDSYFYNSSQQGNSLYQYVPRIRLNNNSPGVTGRCNDSSRTQTTGAYMFAYAIVYGPQNAWIQWRNKIRFYSMSYYTASDAPVIHAFSVTPNLPGLNLNTGCNKLHAANPLLLRVYKTLPRSINTIGWSGYFPDMLFPWNPLFGGVSFIGQGVWVDSKTGLLNLTQARQVTLPRVDFSAGAPRRNSAYAYAGRGPFLYVNGYGSPATRYTH